MADYVGASALLSPYPTWRDVVHRVQGNPPAAFIFIYTCSLEETLHCDKCLAQPRPFDPESNALTIRSSQ